MFSSNAQVEFRAAVKQFSQQKLAEYGSHAYAAGYMESLAESMFRHLSKQQQTAILTQMQAEVAKIAA